MNKKILNVVCVYFSIPFFFGKQLTYFGRKGYEIHLICSPSDKIAAFSKQHHCQYKEISILRKFSVWQDIKAVYEIYKYIRLNKFDTVCGHTPKGGLLSMIAAYMAGVPNRVFFRHGLVYETSTGLKKFILLSAERIASFCSTKVVCVSPYLIERSLTDRLTSKKKMMLLNIGSCNGVDANIKYNPDFIDISRKKELKRKLNIPDEAFIMGYTGRLVCDKGIVELVDAFLKLQQDRENLYLLLVGPAEERDALPEKTVQEIRRNKKIVCTGLIESDMEYYYSLMDVLLLPTYREGLGTSILEASSMGKPVLTTSHTGSRDAIVNGVTGMYININADSIAEKVSDYLNNPELCRKHGENGRKFIMENFEEEIIWKEIEKKVYTN